MDGGGVHCGGLERAEYSPLTLPETPATHPEIAAFSC